MKNKFYKNLVTSISMILFYLMFDAIFLWMLFYFKFDVFSVLLFVSITIFGVIVFLLFHKAIFTKVVIEEEGISFCYRDRVLNSFKWGKVIDIVKSPHYGEGYAFRFILTSEKSKYNNLEICIRYSKKIKECLMHYCPIEELKEKLSKL